MHHAVCTFSHLFRSKHERLFNGFVTVEICSFSSSQGLIIVS